MATVEQRFWSKVRPGSPLECWEWQAAKGHGGYGLFSLAHHKQVRAHRFSWEMWNKKISAGLQLDHLCKNVACVNPLHLEVVTPRENVLRSMNPMACQARQTHCKRGHEFNEANTLIQGRRRCCRICGREKMRRLRRTWRAA